MDTSAALLTGGETAGEWDDLERGGGGDGGGGGEWTAG